MSLILDLTHTFTRSMPVHAYDDPVSLTQVRTLADNHYTDWKLSSGMHVGTHIDGPGHLIESSVVMSDVPVERFVGKGYLIDARNKKIDVSLLKELPTDENLIVLLLTGMDKKFGSDEYFTQHPVMSIDFAHELVKHTNISMIGIDFFSPDTYPFAVHTLLFKHGIFIIENLTHLEQLVGVSTFTVIALPLKTQTDSALARVIALVDDYRA